MNGRNSSGGGRSPYTNHSSRNHGGRRDNGRGGSTVVPRPQPQAVSDADLFAQAVDSFGAAGDVQRRNSLAERRDASQQGSGRGGQRRQPYRRSIEEIVAECEEYTVVEDGRHKTEWLLRLYYRMKSEMRPDFDPTRRSGPSAFVVAHDTFGLTGQPQRVLDLFATMLQKVGLPLS